MAELESIIRWTGAIAGVGSLATALFGLWHQQSSPSGRLSGKGAKLLTSRPYILIATIVYVAIFVLLWRPIPVELSLRASFIFDLLGAMIFFPSLALYFLGMRTLGTMFGASSGFGVRLYARHQLVIRGPYSVIRHPMYVAVICAGIGGLLIYRTWAMLFFAVNMFGLIIRARREERALSEEFGPIWEEYRRRVPAWIPRLPGIKWRRSRLLNICLRVWLVDTLIAAFNFFVLMNLIYEPRWGPLVAHKIGMSTRILVIFILAYLLLRYVKNYNTKDLIFIGLVWLGLEEIFEWGGSFILGRPVGEILVGWNIFVGYMWPYVMLAYLFANLIVGVTLHPGRTRLTI